MRHSSSETGTWAALSVPAPTVEGSWIGQVSEKVSRGKQGPCAAHLADKRFNQPVPRTPACLFPALGTSRIQPPQLPGASNPSYPLETVRCAQSERQGRDWAGSHFNYYTFKTHAAVWGAWVKSISGPHLVCGMRGRRSAGLGELRTHATSVQRWKKT